MKVVHYQPQFLGPESGSANAARGWCRALSRSGVEVVALCDRAVTQRPAPEGVEVISLEHAFRGAMRTPRQPSEWIQGADAVVVHGGWLLCNVAVGLACARAGIPFVVTTHGVYLPEVLTRRVLVKRVWALLLERPHLRRALAVHVFFSEEATSLQHIKVDMPTIVAPNGITLPEGVQWDGGTGGYLLWLGRFDPTHKGLDLLVHAVARIPVSKRPEVRLHGPDWRGQKEIVKCLARDLGVERWVRIGDPVYGDEKWDLIARAGGCVYPSRWDACPVAVAEAAAVGVPTLVTRYPLANFLASRDAAIQADPDASGIADGISRLMSSEAPGVGRNAAEVARRHLSWDAVARSWLEQFHRLLDSLPRPAGRDG